MVIIAEVGVPILAPFTRGTAVVILIVVVIVRLPAPRRVLLGAPRPHDFFSLIDGRLLSQFPEGQIRAD